MGEEAKNLCMIDQDSVCLVVSVDSLNPKQRLAHDVLTSACRLGDGEYSTDGSKDIGHLIMLMGVGGTGKSHVVNA